MPAILANLAFIAVVYVTLAASPARNNMGKVINPLAPGKRILLQNQAKPRHGDLFNST
jgi:hypothetical protein